MKRREQNKQPPRFRPESALLVGPSVGFGHAHQVDPQGPASHQLLHHLKIDEVEPAKDPLDQGPGIFSKPTHTVRFTPRASLQSVPDDEHRTPSIEESEALSPPPLRDGISRSALIHSALFLLLFFKSIFLPGDPTPLSPTLRVDLVGLPDYLKSELKGNITPPPDLVDALKQAEVAAQKQVEQERIERAEAKKEKIKEKEKEKAPPLPEEEPDENEPAFTLKKEKKPQEKKEKPKPETDEREDRLKKALARVKALNRLESIKNAEKAPSRVKTAGLENRDGTLIKGNRLSQGSSLDGDAREAAQSSYYEQVRDKLVAHWALPVWLARQNHQAQVVIFIDQRGRLRDFRFTRPSGSETFDAAVKRALQESQPFIPPPSELASEVQNRGILVGFPL